MKSIFEASLVFRFAPTSGEAVLVYTIEADSYEAAKTMANHIALKLGLNVMCVEEA